MTLGIGRDLRRSLAALLAGLTLGLGVVVPLMDQPDVPRSVIFESQHDPYDCAPAHDHSVCVQLSGSHALPGTAPMSVAPADPVVADPSEPTPGERASPAALGHPSRAPPTA